MGLAKQFTDLECWTAAKDTAVEVYGLTGEGSSFDRDWALRDQMRRAAVSISSNIAEGFGDGNEAEFIRFLRYAYRSCSELESQLLIAAEIRYLSPPEKTRLQEHIVRTQKLIAGLLRYLRNK